MALNSGSVCSGRYDMNVTYPEKFPTRLQTARDISESCGLSESRLLDLATGEQCPHYRIDGQPFFRRPEVHEWLLKTKRIERHEGNLELEVIVAPPFADAPILAIPESIRFVRGLKEVCSRDISGIYFLCRREAVIYVGQSVNVSSRIATHANEGTKDFDRCFFLPVPRSQLDYVEAIFIEALEPPCNGITHGKLITNGLKKTPDMDIAVERLRARDDAVFSTLESAMEKMQA